MKFLAFDTETTGFKDPRIVQLAALVAETDSGEILESFCHVIRPDSWEIPEEATAIHGITTERARREGIGIAIALAALKDMAGRAAVHVAHNYDFDLRMLASETGDYRDVATAEFKLNLKSAFCTMKAMTAICRIPNTNGRGYKFPKLVEAYFHATGKNLVGAHDALADAIACAEIFLWLQMPPKILRALHPKPTMEPSDTPTQQAPETAAPAVPVGTAPQVEPKNIPCAPIPRWKCHKEVQAGKIFAIEPSDMDGQTRIHLQRDMPHNDGLADPLVVVGADFMERHKPQPGNYLVIYADGYMSVSPAKAFEEGYTRID